MTVPPACRPAWPHARVPLDPVPDGVCDCHFHIFGPHDRYPLGAGRSYTPPEASIAAYRDLQRTMGLRRSVIVQASVYGTDNSCIMDALSELGRDVTRAVVVIDDTADPADLARMADAGVCGVRINAVSGNGTPVELLQRIAHLIRPFGWHLQFYAPIDVIAGLGSVLAALPVPVVVDHMGQFEPREGLDAPGFRVLLKLLESDTTWVKLCGYRCSHEALPYEDVVPYVRALAEVAPDRCVWGTDWPHPTFEGEMPDDGGLLDALTLWLPDPDVRRRVLVDNPARLYDFD